MLNHVTLMGRLTRDPELRRTGSGVARCSATIAVERDYAASGKKKEVDFLTIVAWRHNGEFLAKYFKKGQMIALNGKIQTREWTDKDGNKRVSVEIIANDREIYFCGQKSDDTSAVSAVPIPGGYSAPPAPASDFAMLDDDDAQLPF